MVLAVVINMTWDRSKGTSRKLSRKVAFCSPSSTSSRAEAGSPRWSRPSLSISSSRIRGLQLWAWLMAAIIRPGMAPT